MRQCPFEKRYWEELDDAKLHKDEVGMKWARFLLQTMNEKHKAGLCVCQNRGLDARQA